MVEDERAGTGYTIEYWVAVACAAALAALGVMSSQSEAMGIDRPMLGWIAVGTAVVGVIAAALPSIRRPPRRKPKPQPPVVELKPPGPDLVEE